MHFAEMLWYIGWQNDMLCPRNLHTYLYNIQKVSFVSKYISYVPLGGRQRNYSELIKAGTHEVFSTGNKILVHQAIIKQNAKLSNSNEEYFPDHGWNKSCIGKQLFIFCVTVMCVFVQRLFGIYSLSRGKMSVMWLNICTHEKHWF